MLARNTIRINAYETDVFHVLSSIESLASLLLQLHFSGSSSVSTPVTDTSFQWFIQGVTTGHGHLISVLHPGYHHRSRTPHFQAECVPLLHPEKVEEASVIGSYNKIPIAIPHPHARTHTRTHACTHAHTHAPQ